MKFILEAYLDDKEEFWDYGTDQVTSYNPENLFDTTKTGFSYYDNFLNDKDLEYMQKNKGKTGHIEYITPNQYFGYVSKFFNIHIEKLFDKIKNDDYAMNHLREVVSKYKRRINMPYLNFADKQQEGNHRMMLAGELFGFDTKFPVLCVYNYD